jgi:hypothetical protein
MSKMLQIKLQNHLNQIAKHQAKANEILAKLAGNAPKLAKSKGKAKAKKVK